MNIDYSSITNLLKTRYHVDLTSYTESFLNKSINSRLREKQCNSSKEYCDLLITNSDEVIYLLNSLNVSYSEFFRNPLTFSVLERIIIPSLISKKQKKNRKEIRIWSAACAAGQETYSLAMLLEETRSGEGQEINYRIFATDLSESQIDLAIEGCYNVVALNCLIPKRINLWFSRQGENYFVDQVLKRKLEFTVFDLLNEKLSCPVTSIFGDFDIVLCSNLLFYYKPEFQKKILEKLSGSLTTEGYLITGETEREILFQNNYHEVYPQSAIFQKVK